MLTVIVAFSCQYHLNYVIVLDLIKELYILVYNKLKVMKPKAKAL